MNPFDETLRHRLDVLRAEGLRRDLRRVDSAQGPHITINGQSLLNFSSNDYLGLANHPALREAAIKAVEQFGAGAGASRLICGSLAPFHQLEELLAGFKGTEAALTFSNGYAAAMGTIPAMVGKDDIILLDRLVHACIVDAAKLSGAQLRIFKHNDLEDLEAKLNWADKKLQSPNSNPQHRTRVLIATESVFSMDGDHAPLREMVALKEKYGAWLMVDEAHATGVHGKSGRGLAEELGVSDRIEIQMGTLGKALGASGGYICGSRLLTEFLVNRARGFIFSTAPVPAAAAAATSGIQVVQSAEGIQRRQQLRERIRQSGEGCQSASPKLSSAPLADSRVAAPTRGLVACAPSSAIVPIIIGDEARAVELALKLREQGIFVPAIRYPTVGRGLARLRVTLTAAHSAKDVGLLQTALKTLLP
jgi:8-amino-7-oxononanoate synthase